MRRGDLVTVALSGDFGKPRPALIIQSDGFPDTETVTVLLLTTDLRAAPLLRLPVEPTRENSLHERSVIMVDKLMTLRRNKVGAPFGRLADETMLSVTRSLALLLGFI